MSKSIATRLATHLGEELATHLAPNFSPLWAGHEDKLIVAFDSRLGITTETGVSAWADQSSNGNNVSQGTAANQPAYVSGAQAYLDFDGTNDFLETTSATGWGSGQSCTIFCAHSSDTATPNSFVYETDDSGSGSIFAGHQAYDLDSGGRFLIMRSVESWSSQMHTLSASISGKGANDIVLSTVKHTGTLTNYYIDGSSVGSDNSPTVTVPAQDTISLGVDKNTGGVYLDGRIYCFFVINEAMSDADRETIENRIITWLGIT